MDNKTQVIRSLLTTIEVSVDSLISLSVDGVPSGEQLHYKQQLERVSKSLDRLSLIINSNNAYTSTKQVLDDIGIDYIIVDKDIKDEKSYLKKLNARLAGEDMGC